MWVGCFVLLSDLLLISPSLCFNKETPSLIFLCLQELQCLEHSNSALQKEIAALKKDLRLYETVLERHKPHCLLKDTGERNPSSSPPQASDSSSLKSHAGFKTLSNPKRTLLQPSASSSIAAAAAASSAKLLATTSSSSSTPHSLSFSTHPAPHSLFCDPPRITRPSFFPSTVAQTNKVPATSSASLSSPFLDDALLGKLDSSFSAAPAKPSHLAGQNTGLLRQRSPSDVPRFFSCRFTGDGAPPQTPAAQTQTVPAQATSVPFPAAPFTSVPGYSQQVSPGPESLLSLLTVPSPLNHCQATSGSFSGPLSQPAPDYSKDISLSELLEVNEWILSGFGNQQHLRTVIYFYYTVRRPDWLQQTGHTQHLSPQLINYNQAFYTNL